MINNYSIVFIYFYHQVVNMLFFNVKLRRQDTELHTFFEAPQHGLDTFEELRCISRCVPRGEDTLCHRSITS